MAETVVQSMVWEQVRNRKTIQDTQVLCNWRGMFECRWSPKQTSLPLLVWASHSGNSDQLLGRSLYRHQGNQAVRDTVGREGEDAYR